MKFDLYSTGPVHYRPAPFVTDSGSGTTSHLPFRRRLMTHPSSVSRCSRIKEMFAMNKLGFGLFILVASTFSTGCASLNSIQRSEYQAMKLAGVAVEEKNPNTAMALGLLPGGGSFYTRQWGLGVADLLMWPYSILWDPFAGRSGAEVINYDITRAHMKQTKARELSELENQFENQQISQAEFNGRRRVIDSKFDFN
jgi:hypothetical protein